MELEFRNHVGDHMFSLREDLAKRAFKILKDLPEFVHRIREIKGKNTPVLEMISEEDKGWTLFGVLVIVMKPGSYVKIIT